MTQSGRGRDHQNPHASVSPLVQVKYKSNQNQKQEGSLDLPNLLQLEHALNASRLQSNVPHTHTPTHTRITCICPDLSVCLCLCTGLQVHYKKQYEETKARYHLVVDTAEQRHHKDNARLLSQVPVPDAPQLLAAIAAVTPPQPQRCVCVGEGEIQGGV